MADTEINSKKDAPNGVAPTNFSELVRSLPPDMPVDQVLARAKAAGFKVKDKHRVYKVRWMANAAAKGGKKASKGKAVPKAAASPAKVATKPTKKSLAASTVTAKAKTTTAAPVVSKAAKTTKRRATKVSAPMATTSAKGAPHNGAPKAPSESLAAFRQAVIDIGLVCASELIARYKAENAIV